MISGKVVMLGRVTVRELPALVQEKKAAIRLILAYGAGHPNPAHFRCQQPTIFNVNVNPHNNPQS
jgi:hypothetical protein